MGDIDIEIEVERAERVGPALSEGFHEGLYDTGRHLLAEGEKFATDYVQNTDRVWLKRVKRGFDSEENQFSRYFNWQGKITNDAPHAKIVDEGLKPEGKQRRSSPSVQDIIEWVDSEVVPNTSAQEAANSANIGNWDPQLQALAVHHGKANVIAAFAIAESLKEEGYPGIWFTETTEEYLEQIGKPMLKNKIESEMQKKLREAGVA